MEIVSGTGPTAGMRSLPVMNESSFCWSGMDAFAKESQNHEMTGSVAAGSSPGQFL